MKNLVATFFLFSVISCGLSAENLSVTLKPDGICIVSNSVTHLSNPELSAKTIVARFLSPPSDLTVFYQSQGIVGQNLTFHLDDEPQPDHKFAFLSDLELDKKASQIVGVKFDGREMTLELSPQNKILDYGDNVYYLGYKTQSGASEVFRFVISIPTKAGVRAKPVIYLYPTKTTEISVSVKPKEGLSVSIPPMGEGWKVSANPQGKITNLADGKSYSYLFWESQDLSPPYEGKEGFCVKREEIGAFFRVKLKLLGLEAKEIADFLEYWLPQFKLKPYYAIYFVDQVNLDKDAPLTIVPKPDSVIRVYFEQLGLDNPITIKEQVLKQAKRQGFAVVEWGGRKLVHD